MIRTKKIGRPPLAKKDKKYNFTIRLKDNDRRLLVKKFETVQNAIDYLIDLIKQS